MCRVAAGARHTDDMQGSYAVDVLCMASRENSHIGLCGLGHRWQACLELWAFVVVAGFVRQKNENNLKLGHAWKKK